MITKPVAVWILLSSIWGTTWLFIKVGLRDLPPFTFAGIRFIVATAPLALILWLRRTPVPRRRGDWNLMIWTGLLTFTLNYSLVFWGQQFVSSGLAALLYATFPIFGMAMAHAALPSEPMTPLKVVGVLLGVAGVAVIFSDQLSGEGTMAIWGSTAIVLAATGTAWAGVVIKGRGSHLDPMLLTTVQMTVGFVPMLAVGIWLEGNPWQHRWTTTAIVSLLYLALVGSSVTFVLLYWLIRNMDVTKTMLITLATPLIAVSLGVLLLDEELTWRIVTGGLAILSGLSLVVWHRTVFFKRAVRTPSHTRGDRPR